MRVVLQRVTRATVSVHGDVKGETGLGLLALVGFGSDDEDDLPDSPLWKKMVDKILNLRIFEDDDGKLNRSLKDVGGDIMLVSQFTLYADCRKGRRPSFTGACHPAVAEPLFDRFVEAIREQAPAAVATGEFGAEMHLDFTNWGPVTILLDTKDM